jgi:hypothetical protein
MRISFSVPKGQVSRFQSVSDVGDDGGYGDILPPLRQQVGKARHGGGNCEGEGCDRELKNR